MIKAFRERMEAHRKSDGKPSGKDSDRREAMIKAFRERMEAHRKSDGKPGAKQGEKSGDAKKPSDRGGPGHRPGGPDARRPGPGGPGGSAFGRPDGPPAFGRGGPGFGRPGGPPQAGRSPEAMRAGMQEFVKKFDKNGDGRLEGEEREAAGRAMRERMQAQGSSSGRGPRRPDGAKKP
jgi:hypothetical protein